MNSAVGLRCRCRRRPLCSAVSTLSTPLVRRSSTSPPLWPPVQQSSIASPSPPVQPSARLPFFSPARPLHSAAAAHPALVHCLSAVASAAPTLSDGTQSCTGACSSQGSPCLSNRETVPSSTVNISKCDGDEMHEDGSLWGNSDEEADDALELDRQWQNRHDQFYNRGYRDGITAGQNASVQEGFNGGFKDSVLVGYKWGLVRGVTSSLAFLPDQMKAKMIETEESRREFRCLGESVQSISTEDALRLFHEDLDSDPQKQIGSTEDRHDRGTGFKLLEISYGKLLELAQNSPAVNVHMGTDEKKVSSQSSLP
ncbi:hypothetical protein Nepgr_031917 [Nepenthes gracilis]|uniref:Essential protein Yae1 N-terminal domain-containing protein n=1 Tax=Nepenthes gracilis TaxID=150966 RepID=A0AAD3Y7H3_NEPGR|nr:hypothetical protein Nepgr_031917 [Nepenthes gracilis]